MREQALSQRTGLHGRRPWRDPKGLAAALQRWPASIKPAVCTGFPMLLTIKDLAKQLQIKPSTLYAWVVQHKIPSRKIHGLVRFDPVEIDRWVASFVTPVPSPTPTVQRQRDILGLDQLIARAKRDVYTSARGETRPRSSLIRKEEHDGARKAE